MFKFFIFFRSRRKFYKVNIICIFKNKIYLKDDFCIVIRDLYCELIRVYSKLRKKKDRYI